MKKKLIVAVLMICMCLGMLCTACKGGGNQADKSPSEVLVMTIGDSDVYMNEVYFYALSFASAYGITEDTDLTAPFSADYPTMEHAYKAQLLTHIRQSKVLYMKAVENGVTLPEDSITTAEQEADEFLQRFDAAEQEKYGFSRDFLVDLFMQRAMIVALEEQLAAEVEATTDEVVDYGTVENMVFLKIEIDENGNALMDENDEYVYLSEEAQAEQKKNAEEAYERAKNGEEFEALIEEYGIGSVSGINHATTDSLKETYDLKDGEISEIVENDYAYTIVKMVQNYDEEYSAGVEAYYLSSEVQTAVQEKEQEWIDSYVMEEDDLNTEVWEAFKFSDIF